MVTAQLRIVPPPEEWFVQLSTARPQDDFTLQTVSDDGTQLVGIFEAETDDLSALCRTLESIDRIRSHEVLHTDDGFAVIQYATTESIVYSTTIDSGTLPPLGHGQTRGDARRGDDATRSVVPDDHCAGGGRRVV